MPDAPRGSPESPEVVLRSDHVAVLIDADVPLEQVIVCEDDSAPEYIATRTPDDRDPRGWLLV